MTSEEEKVLFSESNLKETPLSSRSREETPGFCFLGRKKRLHKWIAECQMEQFFQVAVSVDQIDHRQMKRTRREESHGD